MGHFQTQQFIATEATPESEQHQRAIPLMAKRRRPVAPGMGRSNRCGQPVIELDQPPDLQWRSLLDPGRVEGLNPFKYLAHQWRAGGIHKSVIPMPKAIAAGRCRSVLVARVCA